MRAGGVNLRRLGTERIVGKPIPSAGIPSDVCNAVVELIRLWSRSRPHRPVVRHLLAEGPGSGRGAGAGVQWEERLRREGKGRISGQSSAPEKTYKPT